MADSDRRVCARCRNPSDWGIELCRRCYRETKAERKATLAQRLLNNAKELGLAAPAPKPTKPQPKKHRPPRKSPNLAVPDHDRQVPAKQLSPRISYQSRMHVARESILVRLGGVETRTPGRSLRSQAPTVARDYLATLSPSQRRELLDELTRRGDQGPKTIEDLAQSVVTRIIQSRSIFRSVASGGLPRQ